VHEGGDDFSVFHLLGPSDDTGVHGGKGTCERYRSGIDEAFCSITTHGRRTGRPHTIEIWFAAVSPATIYALAGGRDTADWVRNVLADPAVEVRIGEREGPATGRVVEEGAEEDALARRLLVAKYQSAGATDLESWGRSALPVAFDLDF